QSGASATEDSVSKLVATSVILPLGGAVASKRSDPSKKQRTRASKPATRALPPAPKPAAHPVKHITARDAPLVERLRKLCLTFPEAGERLSHGEPTWFAGKGKVFAMLDNHHHGAKRLSVWLPMPPGVQESL